MNRLADNAFLKFIAIIYFLAFGSLLSQLKGLIGSNGLLPMKNLVEQVAVSSSGFEKFAVLPSIFLFNQSDEFLRVVCLLALVLALVLFADFKVKLRPALLLILYFLYLSIVSVGGNFLHFQWDALLLETGFLAFLYYLCIESDFARKVLTWLFRLLVFKLMLMSGLVKLSSLDPVWWDLSALSYHYYTQPIPNPIAFFMHQLPLWFHKLSCAIMFIIELIMPWFIFMGRNPRIWAGISFTALMLIVIITGNYCFFNLLTIALCIFLFDDRFLSRIIPDSLTLPRLLVLMEPFEILGSKINERLKKLSFLNGSIKSKASSYSFRLLIVLIAIYYSLINCLFIISRAPLPRNLRMPAYKISQQLVKPIANFHLVSPYGLFANMTDKRDEIIIQGANDVPMQFGLSDWLDYEFYWKPGDTKRLPPQVAPHQPRLDWQMWFAALSTYKQNPWFMNLIIKLLQGDKEVLKLFKDNPYPDKPPKYIRAILYEYKFNDLDTYYQTGEVWHKEYKGVYLASVSLRQ